MNSGDEKSKEYAQRRMNELKGLSVSDRYVINLSQNGSNGGKNILTKSELQEILKSGGDITKARIQKLSRSGSKIDRQYAAELLLHAESEESISFLIELLHDTSSKVRNTAILTAIKKNNDEVIYSLIDNLNHPKCGTQALNALVIIGSRTLNFLDSAFYRSGQSTQTMLRIVQAMGRIGGQRARDLLWNKIDFPDKIVVSQVLLSLGESGFKASISQITRIKYSLESDIADVAWNLNAYITIGNEGNAKEIKKALQREIQNDTQHVYMLLAMLYDTRSIQLVKENIESGTTEGTTYAVELLDVFLSEQLKQRVIPVLDDLSETEKLSKLEIFFPQIEVNEKLILKFLINRDFTQANRWTKANVIKQIGILRIEDFKLDLIAQLFNPDWLVKEIAAWSLHQIDTEEYTITTFRLGEEVKKKLDEVIVNESSLKLIDKVIFFKTIAVFEEIPGLTLSHLADITEEIKLPEGLSLTIDEKQNWFFYIVLSGAVKYYEKGN
ncbi:MAG: HEAT repeat domain-containing protein [Flammeovirgaceae bacterium]|nr:HEAT repeat domain-containing protein [Flammeovirgaceae bacterium]